MPTSIGEPPDEDIFVTIVRGLGRARMNRKAIKGLCLTNRIADGFKLLTLVKSQGIKPNTVIYKTLICSL
ncbi:hypothetical protein FRX31_029779 [Thalictrum thalictroides]|uniref:Pentatricopeptide repeat-containing protein n=1 Tax=Thalictrum thalictroides TaxID=46969 RepID=A0A7J6V696_THATH|nr:hypothetical protein FRX31_029779 [Thalictrum thalictroides]